MTKNQTGNRETEQNFLQEKNSKKSKMDLILPIIFATKPIDGSCYRVIDLSNLQEFFTSGSENFTIQWRRNIRVEKR